MGTELDQRVEERTASLKEANERLLSILDSINQVIQVIDSKTYEILYANKFAKELYGKELIGGQCYEELHGLTGPCDHCPKETVISMQGEPYQWDYHNPTSQRDYLATDRIVKWIGGRDAKLHFAVDITERKEAEEALRASEEKYRNLFENAPIGIFQSTLEGTLLRVNPAYSQIYGYDFPEDAVDSVKDVATQLFCMPGKRQQIIEIILRHDRLLNFENQYFRKDGSTFTGNLHMQVVRNSDESVSHLEGFVEDVTERVRMQEALKESEEWYRTLVEESFDGIFVYKGPKIIFANRRLHEMLGYAQRELIGMAHLQLCHPDYRKVVCERSSARLKGDGVPSKYEISMQRKDGSSLEVEINAKAISIKGEPGIQVWVRDISKEISLQEQLLQAQKMEAIGTLAGGIAHDFNNMLTIIFGYAEILLSDMDEQDPRSEDLDKIVQTAKNGADLVKRLLTFSRKADIEFRALELNVEIERTQKLLDRTLPKMIDIRLNLEDKLAPINADPVQIDQILMNLAINARDAMPDGGKLAIETKNVTLDERYCDSHVNVRPGKYVMLIVSDTGHGMDEPTRARIFDPFFTTKERDATKGTGLGLAVVHGIVDQHGGHMICESEPGKGSTFRVYFPAVNATENPKDSFENRLLDGRGETILMVDDEELVRDLGERTLKRAGYKVITAANGKEALELYGKKQGKIELVILDLLMPEMEGKQCLSELLKMQPKLKVLVASGHSDDVSIEESLRLGANGFVSKPFRLMELLQQVRRILDEK